MSILSIDLHSSKSTIRLSFHFQNVTYESLDDIYCSKFSTGCNPYVLGWRPQPCVSSLQLVVGCPVVIAAAIPDAMLLPTDECFAQEVPEPVYDGLTCPKYVLPKEDPSNCPLRWRLNNCLGCISHDCKLDLVTIQGNLTGDQYIRDVLQPVVIPHFDNHPLATRPVYVDDNARPHRSRAVTAYLQSEAVTSVEGHPCCMHADYLPSLCYWYSPSYHAYWERIIFLKHRT
jgi:hypothetical protein